MLEIDTSEQSLSTLESVYSLDVLSSAGLGLIFTRSQETTQLAKQMGYSIPCDVMLGSECGSWWGRG